MTDTKEIEERLKSSRQGYCRFLLEQVDTRPGFHEYPLLADFTPHQLHMLCSSSVVSTLTDTSEVRKNSHIAYLLGYWRACIAYAIPCMK